MTTPLRAKYIRDLAIRGRGERTQQSYSRYVSELARYYHRSPELISYQEVADWLYYLVKERELSASSINIAVNAVRFLYGVTLERNTDQLMASVPRMKHAIRRAEIYARSEVEAILSAPRQPRDQVFLMTVYACGLRLVQTYRAWVPATSPVGIHHSGNQLLGVPFTEGATPLFITEGTSQDKLASIRRADYMSFA